MILCVPSLPEDAWPTLGPQLCAWIERNLVFGPGDMLGKPAVVSPMKRALIYRSYQVYPKGHLRAGRRRFKRVGISMRKGRAKTEWAAWIMAAELAADAPVRFAKWDAMDRPIGKGVPDPYIPMVATTAIQSEELAYGALLAILERSRIANRFDLGLERIMRRDGAGKALPLASAPSARDGARTTAQHFDETHHFRLPAIKRAHAVMLMNIPKRAMADAWSLETTTAPAPGDDTIAERTMKYAEDVAKGEKKDGELFFFHQAAGPEHDLKTPEGVRAAVIEASGEDAAWSDIDSICAQFADPSQDPALLERFWTNRPHQAASKAFDVVQWRTLAKPVIVADGSLIVIGFDGARYRDSTALVATDVVTGYQWIIGVWEKPHGLANAVPWEVPETDVDKALRAAFKRWKVFRLYADPPYWETTVDKWAGELGEDVVVKWPTIRWRKVSDAVRAYGHAIKAGELTHAGDPVFERHVANAHRQDLNVLDDAGERMFSIRKERPDSPNKIDVAMAAVLSWEARRDALALGKGIPQTQWDGKVIWLG